MLYEFIKKRMVPHSAQTISDATGSISYAELLSRAEMLGDKLSKEKYGLLFSSEINMLTALLACMYAGKTAVPLSPKYGSRHIDRIIKATHLSHLLTDSGEEEITAYINPQDDLSGVALILCTSGTTGTPKGAMITEENLLTNLCDIETYFSIGSNDSILIARPMYHCAVLTGEVLYSLIRGVRIVFFSEGFIPSRILEKAISEQVSVLCGTPTLLYYLSRLNIRTADKLVLKAMAISGECMTNAVAQTIRNAFLHTEIYNVYGLTEASPRVSFLPPEQFDLFPLSIGYLLPSVEGKVQNGELLIRGKSIMRGYYDDETTTKRVLTDGWLHTGDIVVKDSEGRLYIKGRKDNLIIRAGMNIYPQEIENAVKSESSIIEVLVYGIKDAVVGEKIMMKVVTALSRQEVFQICQRVLPKYELPDSIEIVNELPRNASGKVVRNGTLS